MDLSRFKELADGDPSGLLELIELYLTKTSEQFRDLEKAFASHTRTEVTRIAHSMVGANAMVGMDSLVRLLRLVEAAGEKNDLTGAHKAFHEACGEFKTIRVQLKKTADSLVKRPV